MAEEGTWGDQGYSSTNLPTNTAGESPTSSGTANLPMPTTPPPLLTPTPLMARPPELVYDPVQGLKDDINTTLRQPSPYIGIGVTSWTDPKLKTSPDGSAYVQDPENKQYKVQDKSGNVTVLTEDQAKKNVEDAKKEFGKADGVWNIILSVLGGAVGTLLGGLGMGTVSGVGAVSALKSKDLTPEEKEKVVQALRDKGLDDVRIAQVLKGELSPSDVDANGQIIENKNVGPSAPVADPQGGRDQPGSTHASTSPATATPVPVAAPGKTPEQIVAEKTAANKAAQDAMDAKERARFEGLVQSYNPMANMEQFSAIKTSTASNPIQAEAMGKMNDLIALGARSDAVGQKAKEDLSKLTQMTPQNRDAWLQYYNPQAYVATASQGVAGQAAAPTVAQAETMQGTYQGDLSALKNYDSGIARSSERAKAVELGDLLMRRAKGLEPSVAELSYNQNLQDLSASQAATAGSLRGQDRALALRGLAGTVSQQGQRAVNETAILRLQEQQAAEQAAAAQTNAIMIEDQKVASQEKINELSRSINLVQGELANAQNTLEKDRFNADAINKANQLRAQLSSQVEMLNAQQRTQASLENASMATNVSLQNAMKALEANKWAGTAAQGSLEAQLGLERGDWTRGYGTSRDTLTDIYGATKDVSGGLATMGTSQEGSNIARERIAVDVANESERLKRLDAAAAAAGEQAKWEGYAQMAKVGILTLSQAIAEYKAANPLSTWIS